MRIECLHQPVILIGMHRSGTTMIAELLDRLGLFLGRELQGDHEAVYFLQVNDLIFRNVNASWDNPSPMVPFVQNEAASEMTVQCMRGDVLARPVKQFLGASLYRRCRTVAAIDRPWGWKDPRNVFTLPLWLKVFPEAKVINIVRNGVDVAASLKVREQKLLKVRQEKFQQRYNRASTRPRIERAAYRGSARCLELAGGFALWEEYVARAEQVLEQIPNAKTLVVYEQFLQRPQKMLAELARFCKLPKVTEQAIAEACKTVKPSRGNAFAADPQLAAFYQSVRANCWMVKYGYADLVA